MAYENTKALMDRLMVTEADITEILGVWADDIEAEEPHAVNDIHAARQLAMSFSIEE